MSKNAENLNYAYYPGCSLHGTASDYDLATKALFKVLGIGLTEVPDWFCCGSTPAHNRDGMLALSLSAKNLELAEKVEGDLAVACASCFSRLKTVQHELADDKEKRALVEKAIDGKVPLDRKVKHLIDILSNDVGRERLEKAVKKPLAGLKVACYYGCLLTRPPGVPDLDDCEMPELMEGLVKAAGGEPVDWTHRTECCGASQTLSHTDVVVKLSGSVLESAKRAGADCIMVGCPLCQANLDMRQAEIETTYNVKYNLPIMYMSQLLGVAMGLSASDLGLSALIVDPQPLLNQKKLL